MMMAAIQAKPVRVQAKGQVTIPNKIRNLLGIEPGDLVAWVRTPTGFEVRPVHTTTLESTLNELQLALQQKGATAKLLTEDGLEIREALIDALYEDE